MGKTDWLYWKNQAGSIEYAACLRRLATEQTIRPPGTGWLYVQTSYVQHNAKSRVHSKAQIGIAVVVYQRYSRHLRVI